MEFYRCIGVVGGSFLPGLTDHHISEAAAAGYAVLTGENVGYFSHMIMAMQRLNPLLVSQVGRGMELEEILDKLFSDPQLQEARQMAAKQAFHALSSGIIDNVWNLLELHIFLTLVKILNGTYMDPLWKYFFEEEILTLYYLYLEYLCFS
ncbi:hypothetical protein L2E82_39402 [Cichorium intybus]|uniref:Uncharacterized protein n=1 Tax=Cichorium intybus TaxID=13427 RepID=A0ACB9AIQ6_CICIN|nr:hypothetical protein L2E82_39402 [Cichorium intybus]